MSNAELNLSIKNSYSSCCPDSQKTIDPVFSFQAIFYFISKHYIFNYNNKR